MGTINAKQALVKQTSSRFVLTTIKTLIFIKCSAVLYHALSEIRIGAKEFSNKMYMLCVSTHTHVHVSVCHQKKKNMSM